MSSQYDAYWASILGEIKKGILKAANTNRTVILDVRNLTAYGTRKSWYGSVEVSSAGIKKGEMAHAMALGKLISKQGFFKDMGATKIKFKITNSLKLEINAICEQPEKMTEVRTLTSNKHIPLDSTTTPSQSLLEKIYSLLEKLPLFNYSYELKYLPKNGIYFFYEDGEQCEICGKITDRIVRVGTHRANDRFRDRISNHYKEAVYQSIISSDT